MSKGFSVSPITNIIYYGTQYAELMVQKIVY